MPVAQPSSCGPYNWSPSKSMDTLDPRFRRPLERLLSRMASSGLPFRVRGTRRTMDEQCYAKCRGWSQISDPSRGAHTAGFGADLSPADPRAKGTGLSPDGKTVTNTVAYTHYAALGSVIAAEFPELRWGGTFGSRGRIYGWDPGHVELRGYTRLLPDRGYWRCEGGRAVEITDTAEKAKAAVERAVDEGDARGGGVLFLVLGAAGLWFLTRKRTRR